ncbi:MAG: MTH938/NDUFAF3 family protein [Steroidobacteraceae bacterium]|jgi:uncharacterized protein
MRLLLESDPRIHLVRGYGGGEILIGEQSIRQPLIITPQRLVLDWSASSLQQLTEMQLATLFALQVEIVLLGEGSIQTAPSPWLRSSFRSHGIALECMNLGAACRTYNILANEERSVAAGLFP